MERKLDPWRFQISGLMVVLEVLESLVATKHTKHTHRDTGRYA